MLVLGRLVGQKIVVETSDGPIEIVVRDICGRQVKVGVHAPKSVKIMRKELLEKDA